MKHPRAALRKIIVLLIGAHALVFAAEPRPSGESGIEYSSLKEALSSLHAKAGVTFKSQGGWVVANDGTVGWLFTPPGHPAYPTMIKRYVVNAPDGAHMVTDIRCQASKAVCDRYFGNKQ